jgi:hypothetical protein
MDERMVIHMTNTNANINNTATVQETAANIFATIKAGVAKATTAVITEVKGFTTAFKAAVDAFEAASPKVAKAVKAVVATTAVVATAAVTGSMFANAALLSVLAAIAVCMLSDQEDRMMNTAIAAAVGFAAPYALVYGGLLLLGALNWMFSLAATTWFYLAVAIVA